MEQCVPWLFIRWWQGLLLGHPQAMLCPARQQEKGVRIFPRENKGKGCVVHCENASPQQGGKGVRVADRQ